MAALALPEADADTVVEPRALGGIPLTAAAGPPGGEASIMGDGDRRLDEDRTPPAAVPSTGDTGSLRIDDDCSAAARPIDGGSGGIESRELSGSTAADDDDDEDGDGVTGVDRGGTPAVLPLENALAWPR